MFVRYQERVQFSKHLNDSPLESLIFNFFKKVWDFKEFCTFFASQPSVWHRIISLEGYFGCEWLEFVTQTVDPVLNHLSEGLLDGAIRLRKKRIIMENEKVDVIIYRMRDTGLEVFMIQKDRALDGQEIKWDAAETCRAVPSDFANCIELEPVMDADGMPRKAIAIEADWHEIPSLRALIYEDYRVAKEKAKMHIKRLIPSMEHGAFVAVKDALKRIMPAQYAYLKELKDVLQDKEQTKYI